MPFPSITMLPHDYIMIGNVGVGLGNAITTSCMLPTGSNADLCGM